MKVGDILKEEIQDSPALHYPCKIKVNKNFIYPLQQKLENSIFFENCNTFINCFQSNKKIIRSYRSYSQRKATNNIPTSKLFLKKNSDNYDKKKQKIILFNKNFPLIKDSETKVQKRLSLDNRNSNPMLTERSILKNKINKIKNINYENNIASFSISNKKRENIQNIKERKSINQIKGENIFNVDLKLKNKKSNNNRCLTQNIFEYRIKNKMKVINHIINKLNTPIFIVNKLEMN